MLHNFLYTIIFVVLTGIFFLSSAIMYGIYGKDSTAALILGLGGLLTAGGAAYFYWHEKEKNVLSSEEKKIDSFQSYENRYQADDSNDGTSKKRWWRNL